MAALKIVICPECEGEGKAVDNFTMLENQFLPPEIIDNRKRRLSDGRLYEDFPCNICDGKRIITIAI